MATIDVAPGGNLTTAYNGASDGDVIQLQAGSYGAWVTPVGTKAITIQGVGPAAAPTSTFTVITCSLANCLVKNIRARCISDPSGLGGAQTGNWHDTVFEDVLIDGENRTIDKSGDGAGYSAGAVGPEYPVLLHNSSLGHDNTFTRVEIRNAVNAKGIQHSGADHTFDDCYVHDITVNNTGRSDDPDTKVHNEGMYVLASPGLTIKNTIFRNCPTMNVFFTSSVDADDARTKDVTLENNVFGHCRDETNGWHNGDCVVVRNTDSYSIPEEENPDGFFGPIDGWVVRNNLFEHGLQFNDKPVLNGSKVVGNIGAWDNLPGMEYRYNVGTKIHATDTLVSPAASSPTTPIPVGWVNAPAGDFHLTAGSAAIGKGSPTDFPATDIDGATRSAPADAGPYDFGVPSPLPLAMPRGPVNGFAQCADFYDSVGICHHPEYIGDANPSATVDTAIARIQELGLRHVRLGLYSPATHTDNNYQYKAQNFLKREQVLRGANQPIFAIYGLGSENGVGTVKRTFTTTAGTGFRPLDGPSGSVPTTTWAGDPDEPTGPGTLKYVVGQFYTPGWATAAALQGPNEPDHRFNVAEGASSIRELMEKQQDGKNARTTVTVMGGQDYVSHSTGRITPGPAKAPQIPQVAFHINFSAWSLGGGAFGDYSDGASGADAGCRHIYWGGAEPRYDEAWSTVPARNSMWYQSAGYNGRMSGGGFLSRKLPMFVTETGYLQRPSGTNYDPVGSGQRHCPSRFAGEYLIRSLFHNYKGGAVRTYVFSLTDRSEGAVTGGGHFGIFADDFTPREASRALKNLMSVIGFRQATVSTEVQFPVTGFTPGPINLHSDGANSPDALHEDLVLQADDTTWLKPLVRDRMLWDRGNQTPRTVSDPQTVTVHLPPGTWQASVCEPAKNSIQSPSDGQVYANPTDGTAFAPLTVNPDNTVNVTVAGLTTILKLEATTPPPPPPTVTMSSPAAGETVPDSTPDFAGTCSGTSTVTVVIRQGATVVQTRTATPASGAWAVSATALPDGDYTATASQTVAGATGSAGPVPFTVGGPVVTLPAVTLVNPAQGATTDQTPLASGTCDPAGEDTVTVRLFQGGVQQDAMVLTRYTPTQWAIGDWYRALPGGSYQARAEQEGDDGTGFSGTNTFTVVAPTPPLITIFQPPSVTNTATPFLIGTAGIRAEDTLELDAKVYDAEDGTLVWSATVPVNAGAGGLFVRQVDTPLADGLYRVELRQVSTGGNALKMRTFRVASSGQTAWIPDDAYQERVLRELQPALDFIDEFDLKAFLGEWGFPNAPDGAEWADVQTGVYQLIDSLGIWSSLWAASEAFGAQPQEHAIYGCAGIGQPFDEELAPAGPLQAFAGSASAKHGLAMAGLSFGNPILPSDGTPFSNSNPGEIGYDFYATTAESWEFVGERGIKLARLDFLWERAQPTLFGELDPGYLFLLEQQIERAQANGMTVVPDCHNYGRYTTAQGDLLLGSAQLPYTALRDLWVRLSTRWKNNAAVEAYGIQNEPHDLPGGGAALVAGMQLIVTGVRNNGDNKLLMLPAYNWSKTQEVRIAHPDGYPIDDPADNWRLELHMYNDTESSAGVIQDSVYDQSYASAVSDSTGDPPPPPPTVTLTRPLPFAVLPGGVRVLVQGTAGTGPNASTLVIVRIYQNGMEVRATTMARTGSQFEAGFIGLGEGTYSIRAFQADTETGLIGSSPLQFFDIGPGVAPDVEGEGTFTLRGVSHVFPQGTVVSVYRRAGRVSGPDTPARLIAQGTMAARGTIVLAGLAEAREYVAVATVDGVTRSVAFRTD